MIDEERVQNHAERNEAEKEKQATKFQNPALGGFKMGGEGELSDRVASGGAEHICQATRYHWPAGRRQ